MGLEVDNVTQGTLMSNEGRIFRKELEDLHEQGYFPKRLVKIYKFNWPPEHNICQW